jgi:hypothetical protein
MDLSFELNIKEMTEGKQFDNKQRSFITPAITTRQIIMYLGKKWQS